MNLIIHSTGNAGSAVEHPDAEKGGLLWALSTTDIDVIGCETSQAEASTGSLSSGRLSELDQPWIDDNTSKRTLSNEHIGMCSHAM